jgi:hypothetical protein
MWTYACVYFFDILKVIFRIKGAYAHGIKKYFCIYDTKLVSLIHLRYSFIILQFNAILVAIIFYKVGQI